jgi:hypothetical protein
LLPTPEATVELARRLEASGAAAITVHCRQVQQRDREAADWQALRHVVDAVAVPVLANGDIFSAAGATVARQQSGCSGVMLARAAIWNPSVFRTFGSNRQEAPSSFSDCLSKREAAALSIDSLLSLRDTVLPAYLRRCVAVGNQPANSKYVLLQMLGSRGWKPDPAAAAVASAGGRAVPDSAAGDGGSGYTRADAVAESARTRELAPAMAIAVARRAAARAARDFKSADMIRAELSERFGVTIDDRTQRWGFGGVAKILPKKGAASGCCSSSGSGAAGSCDAGAIATNQMLYDAAAKCTGHEELCRLFDVKGLPEAIISTDGAGGGGSGAGSLGSAAQPTKRQRQLDGSDTSETS